MFTIKECNTKIFYTHLKERTNKMQEKITYICDATAKPIIIN